MKETMENANVVLRLLREQGMSSSILVSFGQF